MTNFKKALILAALMVPGIAAAVPATVNFGWEELTARTDGTPFTPESYIAQCGFDVGSLQSVPVTGTSVTWDTELPAASGTVYCGVQAVDQFDQRGELTMVEGTWDIETFAPPGKVIINIDINIGFECPSNAVCTVNTTSP